MKIICISDTHNHYHALDGKLPAGDILIHAGDLVRHGTVDEIQQFVDWYSQLPHRYKIFVGGNHDGALEHSREQIKIPANLIYLENELIEIEGLRIWGSPVSPPYRSFGFMWEEPRRYATYQKIPPNCDIIINHSPPFGILDQVEEGQHVGCQILAQRLCELKPKLVICGHIHEGYGQLELDGTTYVNASIMTRRYQATNLPICIEI
jgi:Icc-related predicted phosphoesterase